MSRGPEAAFWRRVRRAWKGHATRVEASDGVVDPGTPDTILSCDHRGGFVELKVWPDEVSAEQLAWHLDALDRGAYAMVLCELPGRDVWLGSAEEYWKIVSVNEGRRPAPRGTSLQAALNVIACAFTK